MSLTVIGLALFAAILHAAWNAFLRSGADRLWTVTVMSFSGTIIAIPFTLIYPLPASPAWLYVVLSAVLQVGYSIFFGCRVPIWRARSGLSHCSWNCTAVGDGRWVSASRRSAHLIPDHRRYPRGDRNRRAFPWAKAELQPHRSCLRSRPARSLPAMQQLTQSAFAKQAMPAPTPHGCSFSMAPCCQ